ncbi:hypothetical protein [Rhodococcus sp. 1139]|uniref:hypothetical protein n=1 Tax=Rhodococcus sp. 1139 TaxID=1833762 RepID=UPI00114CA93E|nr:hypothetical protein [Rhodococcus sp. 1139]
MAADATEAGTDPGRRYLAGDREPTCPEDRAWLALLDDVVAIQRFRLDREPLGVTWTQTFTPAEKSAHTALPGDDENLFSAGVTLIRQAQIRCDTNYIGNDGVLWRRHHDLRHAAGFPEWKWARYIDDTDILLGVPSPDYLWEKAAGFEDWLHEHPGKARWVPRVKAAFDRKERFHTRKDGSYRGGGWGRRAVAREPGFALIAALSILDENNDEWRRANGDQIDRLCESVITLNEQMSTQWWSQWTAANTTPGTPEQKWTAAVISLATLYAQTEKVPDPRSVTQPLDISEVH